jgi:polysaccharide deacetylase family protein (PEP-CTERM system associated)
MNPTAGPRQQASAPARVINAMSVDVEGFIESNWQSFEIPTRYVDSAREDYEVRTNVATLVELLDGLGIRATFFFLGRIGRDLPDVVREVAELGHEIGSHSYDHLRVFGMERSEFKEAASRSRRQLEDAAGVPVRGFRAPDFSIRRSSQWAVDELAAAGYAYDSSFYPISGHDVYGVPDAPHGIHRHPNGLVEFPLATSSLFGRRFPFGGGGYFRLYPLAVTAALLRKRNNGQEPCMVYIHPYEVGPVIPHVVELSAYRRFRHYHGCRHGARRLRRLLAQFRFAPAIDVLRLGGWLPTDARD